MCPEAYDIPAVLDWGFNKGGGGGIDTGGIINLDGLLHDVLQDKR